MKYLVLFLVLVGPLVLRAEEHQDLVDQEFNDQTLRGLEQTNSERGGSAIFINVSKLSFYPDELTAHAICIKKGHKAAINFSKWKPDAEYAHSRDWESRKSVFEVARSVDGTPVFHRYNNRDGMKLNGVICR